MTGLKRASRRAVFAAAALSALPGAAPVLLSDPVRSQDRAASSFAIVAPPAVDDRVQATKPHRAFLRFDVRPLTAVTLKEAIPDSLASQFGAKADSPFDTRRQLYGWPERPGLYCDVLRPRGLGISAACLRDVDRDGRFDEGLRLDFNSGLGDLLVISHSGKIIGVRYKGKPVPLPHPVAYAPASPAATGRLALRWRPRSKKALGSPAAEIWVSTPDNYTGTEGLGETMLLVPRQSAPLDVELYGIRLRILGFDEQGAMRYRLLGMTDGVAVPLRFRGYTIRIIGY